MKKEWFTRLGLSIIGAGFMAIISSANAFLPAANIVSDLIYQRPQPISSEIVLVGMDEEAVNRYGAMPWDRAVFAEAIKYLNSDPEKSPAVIGIDTLFVGESANPESDKLLVEAAKRHGNVVTASTATFGTELISLENGQFYIDTYAVKAYEQSYEELYNATKEGHINAMIDDDGILRHAIWQIVDKEGNVHPSFHQTIYKEYMAYLGEEASTIPPTDPRYRWYVPFEGLPGSFDNKISIIDLVDGNADLDIFSGKIVLIGPYTQGMFDEYTTAIDHAEKMFGVEYQANAISALIRGEVKTEILELPQTILIFFITLILLMWFYDREIKKATLVWLLITIAWIGVCLLLWELGFVIQVIFVPIATTISFIVSIVINYAKEAVERNRVTNTFRRYVAPEIVSELLSDKSAMELGGKTANIAVLFADIRGFTAMAESLNASEVVEIVNKYLSLTSKAVFDNHGTLDKYIGDCTMAFWGAPIKDDKAVINAFNAAVSMIKGAELLNIEIEEKYGVSLNLGVGINFGAAVIGNVGSEARMDYTAIGDTVNTAARLEGSAPAGKIYVSRVVADELLDIASFRSLGDSVKLKGKADGFEVLEYLDMAND